MGMRWRWIGTVSALAGLALFSGAAHALPVLGADVTCGRVEDTHSSNTDAEASCSENGGLFADGYARAGASATAGVLRAGGVTHLDGTASVAYYADSVMATSVLVTAHTPGTVVVETFYEGSSALPGTSGAAWLFDSANDLLFIDYVTGHAQAVSGHVFQSIPIMFGDEFAISGYLHVNVNEGELDYGHTVELIGLQAYDSAGRQVDASFVDADGSTDWGAIAAANAATLLPPPSPPSGVPEPATLPLLAIGGMAFAASRRKPRNAGLPR